jgi:hypothetical protein
MKMPTKGQKTIPLDQWRRFVRVADWWDRTFGHKTPVSENTHYGRDLIVKTPSAGIDARDGTTVYSATCTVCILANTATDGERQIIETDSELTVYNVYPDAVTGDVYVPTGLLADGTRYVTGEPCS